MQMIQTEPPQLNVAKEIHVFLQNDLSRWGYGAPGLPADPTYKQSNPQAKSGLDRLDAVLRAVDNARAELGKRDRAGASAYLDGLHSTLTTARDAFLTVGDDCDGPAAVEIIQRFTAVRGQLRGAQRAHLSAPPDRAVLAEKLSDVHLAEAHERAAIADLVKLRDTLEFPFLPLLEAFERARISTEGLRGLARATPLRASAVHAALEQGARGERSDMSSDARQAFETEARLWICFESTSELFNWRWARYSENRS